MHRIPTNESSYSTANIRENSSILDIFHPLTVKYRVKFQEFPFINHLSKSLDKSKSKSHRTPWSTSNVTIVPYKVTTISQIPDSVESRQKSKNRYNYTSLAISIANVTRFWAEKKAEHSRKNRGEGGERWSIRFNAMFGQAWLEPFNPETSLPTGLAGENITWPRLKTRQFRGGGRAPRSWTLICVRMDH